MIYKTLNIITESRSIAIGVSKTVNNMVGKDLTGRWPHYTKGRSFRDKCVKKNRSGEINLAACQEWPLFFGGR